MAILNALSIALPTSGSSNQWLVSRKPGDTLLGGAGADYLGANAGGATLAGGNGDDSYYVWHSNNTIIELPGGGIDTVFSYAPAILLPGNVENLTLLGVNITGRGNALDNIIIGMAGAQTIDGGAGNDVLVGGAGADTFVMAKGNGHDVVVDFTPGLDRLRLDNYPLYSFEAVKAVMQQVGADVRLTLGADTLTLRNLRLDALGSRDVMLPANPAHPGMHLAFSDEFTGFSGSATGVDSIWKTSYGINKQLRTLSGNKEAEFYSDSSVGVNPFSVKDGVLDITASPGSNPLKLAYNSGTITTAKSFVQEYGFFEVRAQLPAGQGFWPAFWLLPANDTWPPEIDIFEVLGNDPTTAYTTLHTTKGPNVGTAVSLLPDLSKGFHTFGLDWQADTIKWYIDGNAVFEAVTPADMHQPMYLLLNLGVGDTGSWPGKYAASMPTGHLLIDYVQVWGNGTQPPVITGPDDLTALGGRYTLRPGGASDLYDASAVRAGIRLDASKMSPTVSHSVIGSPFADEVHAGAAPLGFNGGAGDDIVFFGPGGGSATGGTGNDTFVFTKGAIAQGEAIYDFHRSLPGGGEHDLLRFDGFSSAAHLELKNGSGNLQYYWVIDGNSVTPALTIQIVDGGRLTKADYVFT